MCVCSSEVNRGVGVAFFCAKVQKLVVPSPFPSVANPRRLSVAHSVWPGYAVVGGGESLPALDAADNGGPSWPCLCRKSEFHLFYSVVDAMRSGGCVVMRAGAMKLRRGRLREDRLAVRGGRPGLLGEDCCGDGGMRGQRSGRVFGLCCSAI